MAPRPSALDQPRVPVGRGLDRRLPPPALAASRRARRALLLSRLQQPPAAGCCAKPTSSIGATASRPTRSAARRFLADLGVQRTAGETLASLLCYPDAPLAELAQQLAGSAARLHLLVPDGVAIGSGAAALAAPAAGSCGSPASRSCQQRDYDELLWSCDLNFVRGEDSLVRAHLVGQALRLADLSARPATPTCPKLEAFLRLLPARAAAGGDALVEPAAAGLAPRSLLRLIGDAPAGVGRLDCRTRCKRLATPDLASRLLDVRRQPGDRHGYCRKRRTASYNRGLCRVKVQCDENRSGSPRRQRHHGRQRSDGGARRPSTTSPAATLRSSR